MEACNGRGQVPAFSALFATFVDVTERECLPFPTHVLSPAVPFRETLNGICAPRFAHISRFAQDIVMATDTSLAFRPEPAGTHTERFHLLDALRGLLAMLVVLYHSPLELQARFHFPNTYLAVDFFFCLSGFVIASSYADRLQSGSLRLKDFAVVRLARLYPLFALSIACAALRTVVSPLKLRAVHTTAELGALIVSSFLLIPNFFLRSLGRELFPLNAPAWSLFLELLSNAVFAVALRNAARRQLLALLYALSFVALCFLAHSAGSLDEGTEWHGFGFGLARVGLSFLSGAFVFSLFRSRGMRRLSPIHSVAGAAVSGAALVGSLTLPGRITSSAWFPLFAAALLFPALVYLGAGCALPAPSHAVCSLLGLISYPLYILHVPLMLPYGNLLALPVLAAHPGTLPYLAFLDLAVLLPVCLWCGRMELPVRRRLTAAYRNAWPQPQLQQAPLTPPL